jgi:general stress protein 26
LVAAHKGEHSAQLERLLAAARDTISEVAFFWVVTSAEEDDANARVVNAQPSRPGEDFWTRWFLTPRTGRKAEEIRRTGRATLAYQHASGEAFVALVGAAELVDDRDEVNSRFRGSQFDDRGARSDRGSSRCGSPPSASSCMCAV